MRTVISFVILAVAVLTGGGCQSLPATSMASIPVPEIFKKPGESAPVLSTVTMPYQKSSLAVGEKVDMMNRRATSFGFLNNTELHAYLNGLRSKLLSPLAADDIPGKVYVTAGQAINADVTPDGNIYISWRLLTYLQTEDEVAAVIAHELAHVLLQHHDSNLMLRFQRKTQFFHERGIVASIAFSNIKAESKGQVQRRDLKKTEINQLQSLQLLVGLTSKVISPSWQRRQESAADLLGVDLLIKAGYNPDGMLNVLSLLKQNHEMHVKQPNPTRIADLIVALLKGENNYQKGFAGVELLALAWGDDHPESGHRMEDVANYLAQHYTDEETTGPYSRESWKKVLDNKSLRQLASAYDGAFTAHKMLEQGKLDEAYQISRATLSGAKDHAYPAYVFALLSYGKGNYKAGENALKAALTSPEVSGQVYTMLADALESQGDYKGAEKVTADAYNKLDKPPQYLPKMIRYKVRLGDKKGAEKMANDCALNHSDFRDYCRTELSLK